MPLTATSNSSGNACSLDNREGAQPWELFDSGDLSWNASSPAQQESIVRHYAGKVKYLALRMKAKLPRNVELGELISAGTLGLMESFGKFRPQMGIKFDTYAENRIRGAMLDELRRLDWFPRSLRRRVRNLDEAVHRLEHLGESPTEEALCRETGLNLKEVREGLEALHNQFCLSLEMIKETLSPADTGGDENPFTLAASQELIERVAELIEQLTPREKLVLSLYYTDELNMREAAEVMGITEGRVSQLHSQALARLRREFSARHGDVQSL
ncbi:FliA/WhiG family RNA polymerase sigma factor [Desulfovibrio sp. OttesenSCG-928-A18]|nr:FliA/WhiG family RNA polymerase sigma factor [Desulfovibrio sp. OttesenSCG-928-A18]